MPEEQNKLKDEDETESKGTSRIVVLEEGEPFPPEQIRSCSQNISQCGGVVKK